MSSSVPTRRPSIWPEVIYAVMAGTLFIAGFYIAFYVAPLLRHSGLPWWSQKIFYLHLPVAWGALSGLSIVLVGSVAYIWSEKQGWDSLAVAAAECCFLFGTMVLLTGPLWAKPSWGVFWKWEDPRLMSFLALWLVLGAYFMLRAFGGVGRSIKMACAAMGIIGAFSVPFVYLSVKLWRSLHPMLSPKDIDSRVRLAVWVCVASFFFLFLLLMRIRRRLEQQRQRLHELSLRAQELEAA